MGKPPYTLTKWETDPILPVTERIRFTCSMCDVAGETTISKEDIELLGDRLRDERLKELLNQCRADGCIHL